ncbi:inner membrane complex protein [Plasmodium sp. gorilla clade G3]|nr:inner membrane complex protein [Plasmodium sp. gorilla clade G3]
MEKIEKPFDETSETHAESATRTFGVEGYSSESFSITQPNVKEYYTYSNIDPHEYGSNSNYSMRYGCTGNSFICKPQHPKVFIRRVDRKRKEANKKTVSLNGSCYKEFSPYGVLPNSSVHGSNIGDYNYSMPTSNSVQYNKIYSPDKANTMSYTYSVDELNYPLSQQILNNNNSHLRIPLCVQESNYNNNVCNIMNHVTPLNKNPYQLNYSIPQMVEAKCDAISKRIINYIKLILRYIYKVLKLAFQKLKSDLNTKEIYYDSSIPPVEDIDIHCEVCRAKYGNILLEKKHRDCISFFEGFDENRTVFSKMWDVVDNWLEPTTNNNKIEYMQVHNRKNDQVYYQMENFPKDENGKIVLPQFSNYVKDNTVLI